MTKRAYSFPRKTASRKNETKGDSVYLGKMHMEEKCAFLQGETKFRREHIKAGAGNSNPCFYGEVAVHEKRVTGAKLHCSTVY